MAHQSVLTSEVVDGLALAPDATVVDATLGAGGHARALAEQLGALGTLIGIDADATALPGAAARLSGVGPQVHLVHHNFADLASVLSSLHISAVDGIVADLGWRSEQFSEGGRGFSFTHDEPLLMTYGDPADYPFTARDVVNEWAAEDLANVIYAYGEERGARRVARAICAARAVAPIETSGQLADIVRQALPPRGGQRIDPATRTFQALRILVNDELSVLESFLAAASGALVGGGRLAVITFHSLEDRIVKHYFRELAASGSHALITKRPVIASADELAANPRARSAKLRIISRVHAASLP